jgi:uncharacterized RDD family membrane protein YckC
MDDNPYRPPESESEAHESPIVPIIDRRLATRGRRLGAAMIDGLAVLAVGAGLSRAYAALAGEERTTRFLQLGVLAASAINWLLLSRRGQTLGKMLLKIEIVRVDGSPARFIHAVALRAWPFVLLNSIGPMIFPPARSALSLVATIDALFIFTAFNRCIHDRIAGTYVVDVVRASAPDPGSPPSS